VGVAVTFDGSGSSDPDGTIVSYMWDFGDGSTGTGVNPTHTYGAAGTFTVNLTVTDDNGATDSASTTATIQAAPNQPPVSDPNGPYTGTVGVAVTFDGSGSSDPDGTIVSYMWDFGDGSTGSGVSPSHTYAATGTYTVNLTVTDDDGATDTASTAATVGTAALVDLDIAKLNVTPKLRFANKRPFKIMLMVTNEGNVDSPRPATVVGVQNGVEVYNETMMVSAPIQDDDERGVFKFPNYMPTGSGAIIWTATIADDDPDVDEATARTEVR
jgi:PKD repeat protein